MKDLSKLKNVDAKYHVKGESVFIDDIPERSDLLQAAVFSSPIAHGKIKHLDIKKALSSKGVVAVLTVGDVPGENQIGSIIQDEPLLADGEVHYRGQPVALILAETRAEAKAAAKLIEFSADSLPVVVDPRKAFAAGSLIAPPRTFVLGDVDAAWDECDVIVEGRADSEGQEHFYMETQIAVAMPDERGSMKVYSSTQSTTAVQKGVAKVLGVPMHDVEVDTRRLGGAFGGKEDQATAWACLAALGAVCTKRPVKMALKRNDDIRMTGKRHPYSSDFKIGLTSDGKILAYWAMFYQNSGAAADLSTSVLERTLLHCNNTYYIPNVKASAACCKTNLNPFTAYRGFGGPQAMFVIEAAIVKAAEALGMPAEEIQRKNLLKEGNVFPYGMKTEHCRAEVCFDKAMEMYQYDTQKKSVEKFNSENSRYKKGISVMPICFGISFTTIFLNQARSLVHVYNDGSVSVSTGAVEMGQGVNMKILQVAAGVFSVNPSRIRVETTNTSRVANTSPTAASSGSDLNGMATQIACSAIMERLKRHAADKLGADSSSDIEVRDEIVYVKGEKSDLNWQSLVLSAYLARINLSEKGHYATPNLFFDKKTEKGDAFAYHVYGTAITQATLDCLLGVYTIDSVDIVHDYGQTMNRLIDKGQTEGALMQGIGWMVLEELGYNEEGRLLNETSSSYKVPDIKSTPEVRIEFLPDVDNPYAVLNSKAVGEPPFMYGIGSYTAVLSAIRACCPDVDLPFDAPFTPERVMKILSSK